MRNQKYYWTTSAAKLESPSVWLMHNTWKKNKVLIKEKNGLLCVPCTPLLLWPHRVASVSSLWTLLTGEWRSVQSLPSLPAAHILLVTYMPGINCHVLFVQWLFIYSYNSALYWCKCLLFPTHFKESVSQSFTSAEILHCSTASNCFKRENKDLFPKKKTAKLNFFVFLTPFCLL